MLLSHLCEFAFLKTNIVFYTKPSISVCSSPSSRFCYKEREREREREREQEGKRVPICLLCYLACSLRIGHHSVPIDALIKYHVLFLQENHRIMALPTTLEIDIPIQTKTGRVYHSVQTKIQITYGKMTFLSVLEWQII